ncbi:MAG: hypothetical protein JSS76_04590 [Bacteroidetes bacterium]|nr:hypothetical protein [Bacteroidota bacterium]
MAIVGALCTTVGYLTMFALELTVGSRFLSGLVAGVPEWLTVTLIAIVAFTYLGLGGFRTVIVTDRIMMGFIWLLLFSLIAYYAWFASDHGGIGACYQSVPEAIRTIKWSNGLISFVLGILVMNAFTFVSNMGLFQRVAGAQEPSTVVNGMWSSVVQTLIVWSLFVVVAVGAFTVVQMQPGENLLITLLKAISVSMVGKLTIFCVTLGLLGAQLSTASTQLIAVSHTVLEDILGPYRSMSLATRLESSKEVTYSRIVLVLSAIVSIVMVEVLRKIGFSVADMAFSIYGAALGLVPSVLFALYLNRERLSRLKAWANMSIALGFFSGWSCAFYGKLTGDGTIVFLSPCVSLFLSTAILCTGWIIQKNNTNEQ